MVHILFIKTSSLGDVVHFMPAITEVRRHLPDAQITWMVEEDYAPLVRMQQGTDAVIPVAVRRWRRRPLGTETWAEVRSFLQDVRRIRYDAIIDAQGLVRSALLARTIRGQRHGYDFRSARESLAAAFYDVRHTVDWNLHAIARNRQLAAQALGYEPDGGPDFGLSREAPTDSRPRYAVLLHGSARPEKVWPEGHWVAVGAALEQAGYEVCLPWGSPREKTRSETIAGALGRAHVPPQQPLDGVARLLAGTALVVGVDTGLTHVAAALGVPLVAVFGGSDPAAHGPQGRGPIAIVGSQGAMPDAEAVIVAVRKIVERAGG